jgi:hypothetical protein
LRKKQKKDLTEPTLLEMPEYPNREPVSSPRRFKPHRADFQQWAYLLASDQGLCGLLSWLNFRQ